jgi:hypothetical protein
MADIEWVQERDARSLANLRLGAWCQQCCYLDLGQVEDVEELEDIREQLTDPTVTKVGWIVFASEREALEYNRQDWLASDDYAIKTLAEIDARLAKLSPVHDPQRAGTKELPPMHKPDGTRR